VRIRLDSLTALRLTFCMPFLTTTCQHPHPTLQCLLSWQQDAHTSAQSAHHTLMDGLMWAHTDRQLPTAGHSRSPNRRSPPALALPGTTARLPTKDTGHLNPNISMPSYSGPAHRQMPFLPRSCSIHSPARFL
jgi:hypothetical protein